MKNDERSRRKASEPPTHWTQQQQGSLQRLISLPQRADYSADDQVSQTVVTDCKGVASWSDALTVGYHSLTVLRQTIWKVTPAHAKQHHRLLHYVVAIQMTGLHSLKAYSYVRIGKNAVGMN